MEKVTRGLPESPARRVARIARVGARYGFGFVFGNRFVPRRRSADPGRVGTRLRLSFEELGPTFAELGRFLSARRDLLPPDVAAAVKEREKEILDDPAIYPDEATLAGLFTVSPYDPKTQRTVTRTWTKIVTGQ